MNVTIEAHEVRGRWAVLNCPCTVILSRHATKTEALERANQFGGQSFVYEVTADACAELDSLKAPTL